MPPPRDPNAHDLAAYAPEPVTVGYGGDVAGRGALGNQIARLIGRVLRDAKDADIARPDVARLMSDRLGRQVTIAQLDKWSSEAAQDRCIPLDAFAALIEATGQHGALGFLPTLYGYAVVPARYVDMIELQMLEEHEQEVAARKAALQAKIKGHRR